FPCLAGNSVRWRDFVLTSIRFGPLLAALLALPRVPGIDTHEHDIIGPTLGTFGFYELRNFRRFIDDLLWDGLRGDCACLVELISGDKHARIRPAELHRLLNPAVNSGALQGRREFLCL